MKRLGSAVVFVSLLLIGSTAAADSLRTTRGQPVEEVEHTVSIAVVGGVATYTVRRSFVNHGRWVEEATLTVALPPGALADGLRVEAGGAWVNAELLGSARASRMYDQLTGIGHAPMQDPVLLEWTSLTQLSLQVFPLRPGVPTVVEYTLTGPVTYTAGRWNLGYPRPTEKSALHPPVVQVDGADPLIDGDATLSAALTARADAPPMALISVAAPVSAHRVATRYGFVPTRGSSGMARLELDVAPSLSAVPPDLKVVFVLDASQSMDVDGIAAELELIDAWTRRAPGARVEVVVFRRDAEALFGEFVPRDEVVGRLGVALAAGRLAPGNGSHLERGLALAAQRLSDEPGTPRVVALTDGNLRRGFTVATATTSLRDLPPETVLHVALRRATPRNQPATLYRDDAHRLAPLARAHHGVAVDVRGPTDANDLAFVDAVEYLVRPTRLENVTVDLGGPAAPMTTPRTLPEGVGAVVFATLAAHPRHHGRLRGQLWAGPWEQPVDLDPAISRLAAVAVFSEGRDDELSPAEQLAVARFAHVVSPVTSLLAIEPGTRPSTEGLVRRSFGFGAYGIGARGYSTMSRCTGYGARQHDDLRPTFTATLRACFAEHPAPATDARVSVEATGDEIVDVRLTGDLDAPLRACVTEAVWRTSLPASLKGTAQHFDLALLDVAPAPE